MSWQRTSRVLIIIALVSALPYWVLHGAGLRETSHVISATGAVDAATLWTGYLYVIAFAFHWLVAPILLIAAILNAVAGLVRAGHHGKDT